MWSGGLRRLSVYRQPIFARLGAFFDPAKSGHQVLHGRFSFGRRKPRTIGNFIHIATRMF
jgi:hypothetical protein